MYRSTYSRIKIWASTKSLDLGISSTMAFLLWAIWGGFIAYMLEANYLTVLLGKHHSFHFTKSFVWQLSLAPSYEPPIHTVEDILERDIKVFVCAGCDFHQQLLETSPQIKYQKLAKQWVNPIRESIKFLNKLLFFNLYMYCVCVV